MPSYTDPFGGSTVQTALVAYRAFTLAANLALAWPQQTSTDANVAARTMDVSPSGAGFTLNLPQANQVSVGWDLLITNRGANTFTLADYAGTSIATLSAGQSKYVQVTNNATAAGTWNVIAFGVGTSAVDAASLVGPGIGASGSTLYASEPVSTISVGNTITAADRAKTYVWTGGLGTQQLPAASSVTDFFYSVRNQGTGALTVAANGAEQVDGAGSIVLQPTESATLHAGVGNWYSVGRGRSAQFNFTLLIKNITGGTVTLTTTEAANVVQRYTGVLVSNANIVLPSVVQVYYVSNQTTGAFTVTFKTSGVGTTISVPSNQNAVLFCDGTNVINASTTVSGLTALLLAQGSATAPSLGYSGDSSTGIYQPASSQVAITLAGVQRVLFATTGITSTVPVLGPLGSVGAPAYSFSSDTNTGMWSAGADILTWSVGGVAGMQLQASQVTLASPFVFAPWLGAVGTPSYSFNGDLNTGMWSPAADTLAWSVNGAEGVRLTTTGVGIGMTPTQKLDVSGRINALSAYGFSGVTRNAAVSRTILLDTTDDPVDNNRAIVTLQTLAGASSSDSQISFSTNHYGVSSGVRMTIDRDGQIQSLLGAVGTPSYSFIGDTNTGMWSPAADTLAWSTGGTEKTRLDSAGNFGIGTTPQAKLDIAGQEVRIRHDSGFLAYYNGANTTRSGYLQISAAATARLWVEINQALEFGTNNASRATITSGGNLLVGSTTNIASAFRLQVGDGSADTRSAFVDNQKFSVAVSQGVGNGVYYFGASAAAAPDAIWSNNGGTTRLTLTDDGRLYGSALHNNGGSVTGTTNQYIASGTYTPTLNNLLNVTASTAYQCQWIRVGNVVTVSGRVDIQTTTANTSTSLGISLPIASTFTALTNAGGSGGAVISSGGISVMILADNSTPRLLYQFFNSNSTGNLEHHFSATYLIL